MSSYEPPYVYGDIVYDPTVADADYDSVGCTWYELEHWVTLADGSRHSMPFDNRSYAERGDVEAWLKIGRPAKAQPFVGQSTFSEGDLEWLAEIATVHSVALDDHETLAVLARLYGDASPEPVA